MRVLYISNTDHTGGHALYDGGPDLQIGSEYNVEYETLGYGKNGYGPVKCFKLVEVEYYVFDQRNFATLPDQTADDMESETKEAIVPCPAY